MYSSLNRVCIHKVIPSKITEGDHTDAHIDVIYGFQTVFCAKQYPFFIKSFRLLCKSVIQTSGNLWNKYIWKNNLRKSLQKFTAHEGDTFALFVGLCFVHPHVCLYIVYISFVKKLIDSPGM